MKLLLCIILFSVTSNLEAHHNWTNSERDQIMHCAKKYHEYREAEHFVNAVAHCFMRNKPEEAKTVGELVSHFNSKREKWYEKSQALIRHYRDDEILFTTISSLDERKKSRKGVLKNLNQLHQILLAAEKDYIEVDMNSIIIAAQDLVNGQSAKLKRLINSTEIKE